MNAYAIFAINEHLEFLLEEAAERRANEARKPRGRSRIRRILDSLNESFEQAAATATGPVPALTDYPYRR